MFRTEERNHLKPAGMGQNVDGTAPLRIESGVIGDQANMLAAKWGEFLRFENIQAGLHTCHATRTFRRRNDGLRPNREQRGEDREIDKNRVRPLASSQRVPRS